MHQLVLNVANAEAVAVVAEAMAVAADVKVAKEKVTAAAVVEDAKAEVLLAVSEISLEEVVTTKLEALELNVKVAAKEDADLKI
jgi:hypothetical protein